MKTLYDPDAIVSELPAVAPWAIVDLHEGRFLAERLFRGPYGHGNKDHVRHHECGAVGRFASRAGSSHRTGAIDIRQKLSADSGRKRNPGHYRVRGSKSDRYADPARHVPAR